MALSAESIALEKRRSAEAMERYHEQQRELRRELGIDDPEPSSPGAGDGSAAPDARVAPGVSFLEMEAMPSDFHANVTLCPQCGFRNGVDALECARCGVIFSKLKGGQGRGRGDRHNGLAGGVDPSTPPGTRPAPFLDDLGDCFVEARPGYSPYVHEVKAKPWAGASAVRRWVARMWQAADVTERAKAAREGGLRLGRRLKGLRPRWYGLLAGVVVVAVALPFLWKGAVSVKAGWDLRSLHKREAALVAEFTRDSEAIDTGIRALARAEKFGEARTALARFEIDPLKGRLEPLERYLEEMETYARVRLVSASDYETNHALFVRLLALNPTNELYLSKEDHYKKLLADQCYERAEVLFHKQRGDEAASAKAVALIERAVGFYPQNRDYKALRVALIEADLLYYKGNGNLQMALRDEGRGSASYEKQRKISVWIRNSSAEALYINPDYFTLETKNGKILKYNNMMETGLVGKLEPGEKTAGILYFRTLAMPRKLTFEHLVAGTVQRTFP